VDGESLPDLGARRGLGEARRRELEHTRAPPAREQAEEIVQVGPRLEAVELAARERRGGGIALGAVVAADEEPVLAADGLALQLPLAVVVVERAALGALQDDGAEYRERAMARARRAADMFREILEVEPLDVPRLR
jgi:hypothetical protein